MTETKIKEKGESDYDYKNDVLFFKASEKDYARSIELNNIVIDIDKRGSIVGVQIFEASQFLEVPKESLLRIGNWEFKASITDGTVEIRLLFSVEVRNKMIEKNPIIVQSISEELPDSNVVCGV